jgi:TonB family protein
MRTMLAILAISPVMLHAQVKSSAQPESTPVLQSRNVQPAVFADVKAADTSVPRSIRISTGVTPPKLIHSVDVDQDHLPANAGGTRIVTVEMTVDENGKPTNVTVAKSADLYTDAGVVKAVNQYRYQPATLDGNAVPMAVKLHVTIQQ